MHKFDIENIVQNFQIIIQSEKFNGARTLS